MINFGKPINTRTKYLMIAWFIITVIIALEMKVMSHYKPTSGYTDRTIIIYFFIQYLAGLLLILFIILPFFDRINTIENKLTKVLLFLLHGLAFGLAYTFLFSLIFELYNEHTITANYSDRIINLLITDSHNSVRTYLIFIGVLIADDYFKKHTASIILKKNAENEVSKVKLESLRAQLQPHFLFNALNNVVALIDENKHKAQSLIIELSDLLRYTIHLQPQQLVPMEKEIELIEKYISIEKSKYEEQLEVLWKIEDGLSGMMVPPLIVQPLIENAIKHGFKNNNDVLTIKIVIKPGNIQVRNNGSPLDEHFTYGQGLGIVQKRLAAHYQRLFNLRIFMQNNWVINEILVHEKV